MPEQLRHATAARIGSAYWTTTSRDSMIPTNLTSMETRRISLMMSVAFGLGDDFVVQSGRRYSPLDSPFHDDILLHFPSHGVV